MWKALSHILFTSWTLLNFSAEEELFIPFHRWGNWVASLSSYNWSCWATNPVLSTPRQPTPYSFTLLSLFPTKQLEAMLRKCSHSGSVEKLSCLMWWLFDYFKKSEQERTQKLYTPFKHFNLKHSFFSLVIKGQGLSFRVWICCMEVCGLSSKKPHPAMYDFKFL